jgi:hypothetical protein
MPRTAEVVRNDDFLTKVRDRFKYCLESWKDIREQHDLDMRFLAGDSWDEREKNRRKDNRLPMIHLDELTQYINQLINDIRQNKRAVNVLPKGSGANDKTAGLRADWVRAVEYISQAQTAYITGAEGAFGGSYGFWKLETFYDGQTFDLSVRIVPVPNANTILMDPDCVYYDCSDGEDAFEINFMSEDAFKRRWPKAEIKSFTDDIQQIAPDWLKPKQVQVASYWKVEKETIGLHLVDLKDGKTRVMRENQLPKDFDKGMIIKSRDYEDRRIVQHIINGVETLEKNDPRTGKGWPGQWIPIIPVWGKELFVDEGSGSKRMLFSLIRLARDPQRLLNYYASQEMAEAKLSPRTPYMGPRGMFSNQKDQWEDINEVPKAYAEYDTPEGFQPGSVEPKRLPFAPNFQQYEIAKEAASRSIMKAMGISPLPVAAQQANQKSGIALKKIEGERQQGTFHFIDNFDRSLVFCGKQLDDIFDRIHDTPRDIPTRTEDGKHKIVRIGDPGNPKNQESQGDHDVTISTGPSFESQREEAADFADTLSQTPLFPRIADLVVRLRNLGPIGEKIAERLTPPDVGQQDGEEIPPTAKAALSQANQQIQTMQQVIAQLQQEKAAKIVEKDAQYRIAALQENTKLIVAQATLQKDQAESILQAELAKIQGILDMTGQASDQQHAHDVIAHQGLQDRLTAEHQANQDMSVASHQQAITPPEPQGATQ